ncbi:MAG TPA: amidohydrolase family protein [Myxococcota bacterium]|nr:amidohydrolase family protein [Myxococcota bacterium]
MQTDLFDRYRVIDVDTHVSEPYDLWTSRVSSKWGDLVPHVVRVPETGVDHWAIGDTLILPSGVTAMAGYDGMLPDHPPTLDQAHPACHDARARVKLLDDEGIHAQILYPNVGGFGSGRFLKLGEPALMLECVRAYNDFLVDWCSVAPERLIAVTALPFWDVRESVREIERCAARGHRGVLFGSRPDSFGQPLLADPYWDPIWAAAQDARMPISFHIGSQEIPTVAEMQKGVVQKASAWKGLGIHCNLARQSVMLFMDNVQCIADVILGGVCHRFPRLDFVSVESGAGWVPFALEALDWQWGNNGVRREHPEYDLLPSEYFRRQIYACFWFEEASLRPALERLAGNLLWETDYPHPTCQHPGPTGGWARRPREYAEHALRGVAEPVLRQVLHDNAAALYGLD